MHRPHGKIGDLEGKDVLCLASGGGQQSAAFGVLGANVTVLDLSETQLQRDRQAAEYYGWHIETVQGDMRDLSRFGDASFDVVYHPWSIIFVPDVDRVFREVGRVLRVDGIYYLGCANPFTMAVDDAGWNGIGYPLRDPYVDGAEITDPSPYWDIESADGTPVKVRGPREFRHTLSTLMNGLIAQGFVILRVTETTNDGKPLPITSELEPGTWDHFESVAALGLHFWASYRPYVFA